ncbi:flagellar motor switch protein FliN [Cobetia marina]|jgi:flagellar motor switch protein FliN/FliY|uniref:flagellar motor switch protein FliN n=1 Tax=Cobetia TaxID=204286 RepID=UPI0010ADC5B1|nr:MULTISPECIES: flagellar motor switch protein FliN [Cobetia]MDH2373670.1 flagellar motor switch protein FliN [Cobetia sp. 3AK]TKD63823.1 flagellar motor switch protein FliN [Cobetia marina]GED40859.1 flagellar motor switch protein FliN [Cobetia marina]
MSEPNSPEEHTSPESPGDAGSSASGQSPDDPWAEAMTEQMGEEWAQAMEEQAPNASAAPGSSDIFQPLDGSGGETRPRELDMIMDIPVKMTVELGRTRLTIKQLLELSQGSVIELDGLAGEPMDILINGYLIAQGEVVVVEDKYGIRITEIITPNERVQKLNR